MGFIVNFLKKLDTKLKQRDQSLINTDFLQQQRQKNNLVLQDSNTANTTEVKRLHKCNAKTINILRVFTDKGFFESYECFKSLLDLCHKNNINAQVSYGYRSIEEQDELYKIGRDENGKIIGATVTPAKGGQSFHNYGLAIDVFVPTRDYQGNPKADYSFNEKIWELAKQNEFDKKYNLYWGIKNDGAHFERSGGLTITPFKKKFNLK